MEKKSNTNTSEDEYNSYAGATRFEKILNRIKDRAVNPDKYQKIDVIEAAKELERNNFETNKICAKLCKELKKFVSESSIRSFLENKYKETEKIRTDFVTAQIENSGKSSNDVTKFECNKLAHSKKDGDKTNNEDNEDKDDGLSKKDKIEQAKASYEQNRNYRMAQKFGDGGGSKWGRSRSSGGGGSWVSTEERESNIIRPTNTDTTEGRNRSTSSSPNEEFYNDDMEALKKEFRELRTIIKNQNIRIEELGKINDYLEEIKKNVMEDMKTLEEKNKNLMEQRVEYTTVMLLPAMYGEVTRFISQNPPGKIYLGFDKDFIVNDVRLTEEEEDDFKKRFIE